MTTRFDCVFQGTGLVEDYAIPGYPGYSWRRARLDTSAYVSLSVTSAGVTNPTSLGGTGYVLWDDSANTFATFDAPATLELYVDARNGYRGAYVFYGTPSVDVYGSLAVGENDGGTFGLSGSADVRSGDRGGVPYYQHTPSGSFGAYPGSGVRRLAVESISSGTLTAHRIDGIPLGTLGDRRIPAETAIGFSVSGDSDDPGERLVITRIRLYDNNDPSPPIPPNPEPEQTGWWRGLVNTSQTL